MNIHHASSIKMRSVKKRRWEQFITRLQSTLLKNTFILIALLLCTAFLAREAYNRLCHSDFFQVTALKIEGNRMTSKEQIAALSGIDIHSNLLAINVSEIKSFLESHPWIARVEIIRDWPNRLLITVKEKKPVALISKDTGLFYLDNKGMIIAAAAPSQELDFPVITGLETFSFNPGAANQLPDSLQQVMSLLKLADRNNTILPEQNISEINISKSGELVLYLLERAFPIYLGKDGDISTRYYRLVKVLRDLYKSKEFAEVSYIRFDYQKDSILVGKEKPDSLHRG
jgi:cell division protein FtsQ